MVKVMVAQAMKNGTVYLFDSKDMELYYSKEEQDKYGVVGIEIKLL